MTWWIIGTSHLGTPPSIGWHRGDEHPAFEYLGVCAPPDTSEPAPQ